MSEDDPHKLIRVGMRVTRQIPLESDRQTVQTVKGDKRTRVEDVLVISNYEVNGPEKVEEWIKKNSDWKQQHPWIPAEHPIDSKRDTFRHIYEMGNTADDPIFVEDDGAFIIREIVTPGGVVEFKESWESLPEYEKSYYREKWWYEKPWELLKDPGASMSSSDSE